MSESTHSVPWGICPGRSRVLCLCVCPETCSCAWHGLHSHLPASEEIPVQQSSTVFSCRFYSSPWLLACSLAGQGWAHSPACGEHIYSRLETRFRAAPELRPPRPPRPAAFVRVIERIVSATDLCSFTLEEMSLFFRSFLKAAVAICLNCCL